MATVQAAVKESLLGTTREPELSTQTRATFDRHAKQDEASEEYFMTEHEFVDAIAPENEDYVSYSAQSSGVIKLPKASDRQLAQNQPRAICHTIPDRGSPKTWPYQSA